MLRISVILALLVSATLVRSQVVINEVMAENQTAISNEGEYPDWVELYNSGSTPADISDWSITDSQSTPRKYVFPAGTVVPAQGHLVVWLDAALASPGLHTGFSVSGDTDDLTLFSSTALGQLLVDRIAFGIQVPDTSVGRVPNGTANWTLTQPTPELSNEGIPLGQAVANSLWINEIMADPPSGVDDWFELYNATTNYIPLAGLVFTDLAGGVTNRAIANLSFIGPGAFIQFIADSLGNNDFDHVDFRLSAGGERVVLYQPDRATVIDRVDFGPQTNNVSYGRLPDGGPTLTFFAANRSTPEASNFQLVTDIIINEVLTHTDPPLEDAIELYNPTANPLDISFWWLSNSKDDPKKFRIPAGTVVPAGGYKVFYEWPGSASGFNSNGLGIDRSFTLNSAHGDEVYLHTADAAGNLTFFRTSRDFGPAENGVSFGRYITSEGKTDFVAMNQHTFGVLNPTSQAQFRAGAGVTNAYPKIGPIVINEIMYHPPDLVSGTNTLDNSVDEYVELYNITPATIPLYDPVNYGYADGRTNTWRLRGVIDFDFPRNISMGPGDYVLLVNFDPNTNTTQLATFRSKYGVPLTVPIFGPYEGKLQNGQGSVELYKPDPPQSRPPEVGFVPYLLVDRVKYSDTPPWPADPDGNGSALLRLKPQEYGNDPINWIAAVPTPGKQLLRIESIEQNGTATTIRFTGLPNTSYTLQAQSSLSGSNWFNVATAPAQTNSGPRQISHPTTEPMQFYRIAVQP